MHKLTRPYQDELLKALGKPDDAAKELNRLVPEPKGKRSMYV